MNNKSCVKSAVKVDFQGIYDAAYGFYSGDAVVSETRQDLKDLQTFII